jgi:hypothetical protein
MTDRLVEVALELTDRAGAARWRGPDPYDGLWWSWPRVLVGGRRRRQAITQIHVRSPVDVRRLYRHEHPLVPKGLALFGSTGLRIFGLTGIERAKALALDAIDLLDGDRQAGPNAWGYHWDVQTRWSFCPAGSPSIIPTAFAVSALLEAEHEAGRKDLGRRARTAARWVFEDLWVSDGAGGFFAYHPHSRANIHNANLLGASLVWAALGDQARERALHAVERTIAGQRRDGSWPYGEGGGNVGWIDSFHTGYVLLSLDRLRGLDPEVGDAVARGAEFYRRFFGPAGESRLWPNREYPEDGHSAGTALSTLAALYRHGVVERELLDLVSARLLSTGMRSSHPVFRRYGPARTFVHYQRWCDGHVALGLADAAVALAGKRDPAPVPPDHRTTGARG